MSRSLEWEAAAAATRCAETCLDVHKQRCARCATPRQQMCDTGRGLLNHLWDCQQVQHEAWHGRQPEGPGLFPELDVAASRAILGKSGTENNDVR